MADTGRIDDLRRRLERDPGSLAFAQLAEELRKAGQLDEAVRMCREGMGRHPNYLSAHMTLGRALFDQGDLEGASAEFEAVLRLAPDNILAGRLLADSHERQGRLVEARTCLERLLPFAPGDAQLQARFAALDDRVAAAIVPAVEPTPGETDGTAASEAGARAQPAVDWTELVADEPAATAPEPAPIPVVAADEAFELESPYGTPATDWTRPAADAAVATEEMESPFDSPVTKWQAQAVGPAEDQRSVEPTFVAPAASHEQEGAPTETFSTASLAYDTGPIQTLRAAADEGLPAVQKAVEEREDDIATVTLGDLYLQQGILDRAADVFQQVLEHDPGNARALDGMRAALVGRTQPPAPATAAGDRSATLQRTIRRLEDWLHVVGQKRR
jgi:Flp pilus assembly protein TadD